MTDPILGDNIPGANFCTRAIKGGLCGNEAAVHIIWERYYASVCCVDCEVVARGKKCLQIHAITAACLAPDMLWFPDEHKCRGPRVPEDYAQGVVLLDD